MAFDSESKETVVSGKGDCRLETYAQVRSIEVMEVVEETEEKSSCRFVLDDFTFAVVLD